MEKYKYIVDILSSTASLIAILTVLYSWYKSAQKPLAIDRVVVHKSNSSNTYILVIKNRKPYPVTIKATRCYTTKVYEVEVKTGRKPEYSEQLLGSNSLFQNTSDFEIAPNGHTDIRITGSNPPEKVNKLLFSINTSHGYHELWCKEILLVDVGVAETYDLDYRHPFNYKITAKLKYYWLIAKHAFRRKS